jgi:hypothetical protein
MSIRQGNNIIANKTVPSIYTAGPGIVVNNGVISSKAKYIYETEAETTEWRITHNLNDFPSVTVVDSANTVLECEVQYDGPNVCIVRMNSPCTGRAYLN